MKRALLATLATVLLLTHVSSHLAAVTPAPLAFFKSFIITGDYVVEGVGLRGMGSSGVASGHIVVDRVPPNVDIAAAFLYWQVEGSERVPDAGARGVTFRGHALDSVDGSFGKPLGSGSAACVSSGAGDLASTATRVFGYRADVLRYLDVDPVTRKLAANGTHAVQLPDGNGVAAIGASLVIVYRDPSLPLSAVVIYDGAYTTSETTDGLSRLQIGGFYDASTSATLTPIVGNGQASLSENLTYNGAVIAVNPFTAAAGPGWDNPTVSVTPDPARREVQAGADYRGLSTFDCLTWSAVVYRTTVNDGDGDGLLDLWETSTTPILDPTGRALPNLAAMGAAPDRKDLFIEVGYMKTDAPTSYGGDVKPTHSHLPSPAALKLVGDMFANAQGGPINVHFDVGESYPSSDADPYVIRGAGLARGGEAIDESATVCTPQPGDAPWVCQFGAYPGTVGWKTGYRLLRDEVLTPVAPLPDGSDPCDLPGNTCERRFDQNRHDTFHYVLFAHALGLPRSELACLDASGAPVADVNDQCAVAVNPEFRVPRTYTGVGDFPGGDMIVSLGAFVDTANLPIGTPFMQAATLAHELGHNAERRHGGEAFEPNCKPGYLSAMNYLYQLRGLLDDAGTPHLDFSGSMSIAPLDESALIEGGSSFLPYRLGWYAPLATSYLAGRAPAARTHCDGSPLLTGPAGELLEVPMVRIDALTAASPFDWNGDRDASETTPFAQDINFDGRSNGGTTAPLGSSDDWASLRLNQIGTRRNVGGLYDIGGNRFGVGPLSLSVGKGDLGKGDLGKGDLGKGDLGKGDLGKGDLGKGDLGKGDLGKGDLGKGDLGGGDLFTNNPYGPEGELDFETVAGLARTPPNQFAACVSGVAGCGDAAADLHDVVTTWSVPNVGGVAQFTLYRVNGSVLSPGVTWTVLAQVPAVVGQEVYTVVDTTELLDGAQYTYFAVANYTDGVQSDPSNVVTLTARNVGIVAGNDVYVTNEDTTLVVPAPGVLGNDDDQDTPLSLAAELVSGPSHGSLTLAADGSFVYTPVANYFGADAFTYRAVSGPASSNVATVTITVTPVNDAPGAFDISDVTIDQDTSTSALPFSVSDEMPATVTASAASSNTTVVPLSGVVFGGAGAARTVTVTPVAGATGTAVITVTLTDAGGLTRSDTFTVTVRATTTAAYAFVNVKNAPAAPGSTFKAGRAVPLQWRYTDGSSVVASAGLRFEITVTGPAPETTLRNTDTGTSDFRYKASTRTWSFNLQTRYAGQVLPPGTYTVTVRALDARFASSQAFPLTLIR